MGNFCCSSSRCCWLNISKPKIKVAFRFKWTWAEACVLKLTDFNERGNKSTWFTVRYSHCTPRILFDFNTVCLGICWLLLSCRILLPSSKLTTEHAGKGLRYCGNITSKIERVNTS